MQIILIKPIKKLGNIGDLVEVKNGYARNYLLPQNIGIRATNENKLLIEQQKSHLEEKNHLLKLELAEIGELFRNKIIVFIKKTTNDYKLFGSITTKEILQKINELSNTHKILSSNLLIPQKIKTTGVFPINILLHADIIIPLKLIVAKTEQEVEEYLNNKNLESESYINT